MYLSHLNHQHLSESFPREVPDSSAEISDLAKKLGARLFQDTSILEQLQSVKREKSFVEQLREIVASSSNREPPTKPLQFIPSTPIASQAKPPVHPSIECKEIDVQTSWVGEPRKEMRDNATDLPSLDYLSMSELGGLRQLPETFVAQEEVSSSAFSSDQSAGQVPPNLIRQVSRFSISIFGKNRVFSFFVLLKYLFLSIFYCLLVFKCYDFAGTCLQALLYFFLLI
ncbi:unnamed protein product [Cylicostephanus goldi]|uniref:Uncharacterized protein n=1 Tax=Cylicostephanus goldi TaxID=71465 RepID=A0A3P6S4N5_CYLGO|nr:unnamed protein product [Cylicostephanus goldi]